MSDPSMPLTPGRCRRAREGLGWTRAELGAASGVPPVELARFEAGLRGLGREALAALRDALVAGGTGSAPCPAPAVDAAAPRPDLPITPDQCRRAREALGWSLNRLGREAGLKFTTVGRFEQGSLRLRGYTIPAIRRALVAAGVEFLHGEEPDIRLRIRP